MSTDWIDELSTLAYFFCDEMFRVVLTVAALAIDLLKPVKALRQFYLKN